MKTSVTAAGYILAIALLSAACTKKIEQEITYNLHGKAEKGPFVQGSKVTIYELNTSFVPTGRSFTVDIGEKDGSFSLNHVELISPYVLLDANGFYFNEVSGTLSDAQINLTALVDLRQSAMVNVNLLTHLERQRVENLLAGGKNFAQAKKQAQREVLSVFGLTAELQSEQIELCGNDATLLAVSSILQSFRTEAELSSLLSVFSQDIAQKGEFTNKDIFAVLSNDALCLSAGTVRNNLIEYYRSSVFLSNPDSIQVPVLDLAPILAHLLEQSPSQEDEDPVIDGDFFYYFDKKIPLQRREADTDKIYLKIVPNIDYMQIGAILNEPAFWTSVAYWTETTPDVILTAKDGSPVSLTNLESLKAKPEVISASYLYQYRIGQYLVIQGAQTDEFTVKLKETTSFDKLQSLAKQYDCLLGKEDLLVKNQFNLYVPKTLELNAIQMSKLFYETGLFEFSLPNFRVFSSIGLIP